MNDPSITWRRTDVELAGHPGWGHASGTMPSHRQAHGALDRALEGAARRDQLGG